MSYEHFQSDSIYTYGISSIKNSQYYLRSDNTLGIKEDIVYMYLRSATNPGEGWTRVWLNDGSSEYRKLNPAWNTYYGYFYSYNLWAYDPIYSCPFCMQTGRISKTLIKEWHCGQVQDETPICNQVVTYISATNPTQTVDKGGSIITTATATYLDGHKGIVNCTSNFNPNQAGMQTVTLIYSGLVGGSKTTGIRTCTATITVRDTSIPVSLTVTPSSYTVYNGTEPGYTVRVNYTSGSSKVITSGYTKTGFTSGPGTKTVTFQYTENGKTVSTSVTITVKPNLSSITVSPSSQQVERYKTPSFTVIARYEDGSTKQATGYTQTGFNGSTLGSQNVTVRYIENSITRNASVSVTVTPVKKTCPVCGTVYELNNLDRDIGCPACSSTVVGITVLPEEVDVFMGSPLPVTVEAVYRNGNKAAVTGWTSNFNSGVIGIQEVTLTYQTFKTYVTANVMEKVRTCPACGNEYDLNTDGSDPGCPLCREEVVSISSSPEHVTIEKHQPLNLTVTATYRDGHSGQVTGWSSDLLADRSGTFDVTVSYKTATDHILVTVLEDGRIQCLYCGLDYSYREQPEGCPVCHNTILGIEASLRNGGTRVPYKSDLNLQIVIVYKDTHRSLTYSGWTTEGFQPDVLGIQTVTVWYQGFSTLLTVEVTINPLQVTCPYGHIYYLNSDGADPGCPHCVAENSVENAILLFDTTYTKEILESLYADGTYYLKAGDYLTVTIIKTGSSVRSRIGNMFLGIGPDGRKYTFGGEVI